MAGGLAAEKDLQGKSAGRSDARISSVQEVLSKFDPKFMSVTGSAFVIDSDDLKISIRAENPVFYKGEPFQNSAPQSGLYGPVHVSKKFYGIERVLHYGLSRRGIPCGGVHLQERITILYENMLRKPLRPQVFDSKPFVIGKDGTFQDRQVLGHFDAPWPGNALQVLKQELVIESELVVTIYIVRTTKDIVVVGYAVHPLIPAFPD